MNKIYLALHLVIVSLFLVSLSAKEKTKAIAELTKKECKTHLQKCIYYADTCSSEVERLRKILDNGYRLFEAKYERMY